MKIRIRLWNSARLPLAQRGIRRLKNRPQQIAQHGALAGIDIDLGHQPARRDDATNRIGYHPLHNAVRTTDEVIFWLNVWLAGLVKNDLIQVDQPE